MKKEELVQHLKDIRERARLNLMKLAFFFGCARRNGIGRRRCSWFGFSYCVRVQRRCNPCRA
ncbi:MAG: hypothetical protein ACLTT2_04250 [Alphaproteobacteria bacterium]